MFVGAVWFLQGINVLPGSFMTGQTKWAVIGGATFSARNRNPSVCKPTQARDSRAEQLLNPKSKNGSVTRSLPKPQGQ